MIVTHFLLKLLPDVIQKIHVKLVIKARIERLFMVLMSICLRNRNGFLLILAIFLDILDLNLIFEIHCSNFLQKEHPELLCLAFQSKSTFL
jgi:hypothetical protein